MERLEFQHSRLKTAGLVVMAFAFVAVGWLFATTGDGAVDRIVGWCCVAFFGVCALVLIKRLIEGGVAFTFERAGVVTQDVGLLPWADIQSCQVITVRGNRFLSLTFRDPDRFLTRMSLAKRKLARFNERMGWGHWALSFTGLTPGLDAALAFVEEHEPGLLSSAPR